MATPQTPVGWPAEVPPPGTPGFQRRAVGWLFDLCPPDYRAYDVLTAHPLVLARFAAGHVAGALDAARRGLATARSELRGLAPPEVVEAAVAAYEREGLRLRRTATSLALVERALRGEQFVPRL
jgi:hypothetical protein